MIRFRGFVPVGVGVLAAMALSLGLSIFVMAQTFGTNSLTDTVSSATCNSNGACDAALGETVTSCPADCGCDADNACDAARGETAENCRDCQATTANAETCNRNGACDAALGETVASCQADCGCNRDSVCQPPRGESPQSCATDCGCNANAVCEAARGETSNNCRDCQATTSTGTATEVACNKDGRCDAGETVAACASDCGCDRDLRCEAERGETVASCQADCGCNANAVCEAARGETSNNCKDCQTATTGTTTSTCNRNGACDAALGETVASCQADCGCNKNLKCESARGETADNCLDDCRQTTPAKCGDTRCDWGETALNCPADCIATAASCGDRRCDSSETAISCPTDCAITTIAPSCNKNLICEPAKGESAAACPSDCGCNRNASCELGRNENATNCPDDCRVASVCRENGFCDRESGEDTANCPKDCPIIPPVAGTGCGNLRCDLSSGENFENCPADCPAPLARPYCGNKICEIESDENVSNCAVDCFSLTAPAVVDTPALPVFCLLKGILTPDECRRALAEFFSGGPGATLPSPEKTPADEVPTSGGVSRPWAQIGGAGVPATTVDRLKSANFLPPACQESKITDPAACREFVQDKIAAQKEADAARQPGVPASEQKKPPEDAASFLPEECRQAGLTTPEDCQGYFAKRSVSPECAELGAKNSEECKALMSAKHMPKECRDRGEVDETACQRLVQAKFMPRTCAAKGIADIDVCSGYLLGVYGRPEKCQGLDDSACWRLIDSGQAGAEFDEKIVTTSQDELSDECLKAGSKTLGDCSALATETYIQPECREIGIYTRERCDRLLFDKYGQSGSVMPAEKDLLPPDCRALGANDAGSCRQLMAAKFFPQECVDQKIVEAEGCAAYMKILHLPPECREAKSTDQESCRQLLEKRFVEPLCAAQGITDPTACREFLFKRVSPAISCQQLDNQQCETAVKEQHLGEIVRLGQKISDIGQTVGQAADDKGIIDLEALRRTDTALADRAAAVLPFAPDERKKLVVFEAEAVLSVADSEIVASAAEIIAVDSDGDGVPDDVEGRYGLDPNNPDTRGSGDGDKATLAKMKNLSPLDSALARGRRLGQPKTQGEIDDTLRVSSMDNAATTDQTPSGRRGYRFHGRGRAGEVITLYVYSDLPMLLTTTVGENGEWSYDLENSLNDGVHEVYVAVNDDTGKVARKSEPVSFFVNQALAVSAREAVLATGAPVDVAAVQVAVARASALANVESATGGVSMRAYLIGALVLLTVGLLATAFIVAGRRRNAPPI